jgi:hypothetical protein
MMNKIRASIKMAAENVKSAFVREIEQLKRLNKSHAQYAETHVLRVQ